MNLLVPMYHRARAGRHGNTAEMLDAHFALLARTVRTVLPGELLHERQLNVCLTFDDAYYDFYAIVFPLLKKHGLRAVLAVVPTVIREQIRVPSDQRLAVPAEEAFANPEAGAFCTWRELEAMSRSGHVRVAAHGNTHVRLDLSSSDLAIEIDQPQMTLTARLGRRVDSFVFPYGRFSPEALARAHARYDYVFRIGGAMNYGWSGPVLYRIDADAMGSPDAWVQPGKLASYHARFLWNRLRGR